MRLQESENSQNVGGIYLVEIAPRNGERYFVETPLSLARLPAVVAAIVSGEIEDIHRVVHIAGAGDEALSGIWRDETKSVAQLVANDALMQERILPAGTIEWLDSILSLTLRERVYLRGESYEEAVENERADFIINLRKQDAA